jgi:DNA-binding beta-propeller fold protein YncE
MFRPHSRSGSRRRLWLGVASAAVVLAVAAPAAQAAPFVYVSGGYASREVSQFAAGQSGLLAPLSPPTVAARMRPLGLAVSPDARSLYVANAGCFEDADPCIDAGDGDSVSQYNIGATGNLSPKSPPTVAAGDSPTDLAVSADGKSVYVADEASNGVSQYDIGPGGKLSPKSPAIGATVDEAVAVAVSPDGESVYVVSGDNEVLGGDNAVYQYDVGLGGTLSPKSPLVVDAGDRANDIVVSPDGKSVYVVNIGVFYSFPSRNTASVSQYNVGPGGTLSPKSPAMVSTGVQAVALAVTPNGKSIYVVSPGFGTGTGGSDNVYQYEVGPSGALAPKSPPRVATGEAPHDIVVSPDGESVYVTAGTSSPQRGSVSQYDVDAGGRLSLKSPATVNAGPGAARIAVSPAAPTPTTKQQCKHGGWKQFDFKNQGRCIRLVKHGPKK